MMPARWRREVKMASEVLYNGIALEEPWPPRGIELASREPLPAPYLRQPPACIPIDVGRQLFVDDFLIETTTLTRRFHYPARYEGNPILRPETPAELNNGVRPCATVFNDGVWFDPADRLYKMWYHAGWFDGTALAVSNDGAHFRRPALDVVPGTNLVLPREGHGQRDGAAVWLDHAARDPAERFKMFLYERPDEHIGGQISTSHDGVHWTFRARTPVVGDNTTVFYNPFRRKWCYSIRNYVRGRTRAYREHDDLVEGANWRAEEVVPWARIDALDKPDPGVAAMMPPREEILREAEARKLDPQRHLAWYEQSEYGVQLYNVDAVAYESLMLGVFTVHRGPPNHVCEKLKRPKLTDLEFAYSRDGFHWHRPDRTAFLAGTQREGDWDRAYLHIAASICTVSRDRLCFYYGGWSGKSPRLGGDIYADGAMGIAFLRRDGFASMDAGAEGGALTTRPVTFGGDRLFVNVDCPRGELRVEVLDENGAVIEPFTRDACVPLSADATLAEVRWKSGATLAPLAGQAVRFRFHLTNGRLYAFWVTRDPGGGSNGYLAAGGADYRGVVDALASER